MATIDYDVCDKMTGLDWATCIMGQIGKYIVDTLDAEITSIITAINTAVGTTVAKIADNVRTALTPVIDTISTGITTAIDGVISVIDDIMEPVQETFESWIGNAEELIDEIIGDVGSLVDETLGFLYEQAEGLLTDIGDVVNTLISDAQDIYNRIVGGIESLLASTTQKIEDSFNTVVDTATLVYEQVVDIVSAQTAGLLTGVETLFVDIGNKISTMTEGVVSGIQSAIDIVTSDLGTLVGNAIGEISATVIPMTEKIGTLLGSFDQLLDFLKLDVVRDAKQVWSDFKSTWLYKHIFGVEEPGTSARVAFSRSFQDLAVVVGDPSKLDDILTRDYSGLGIIGSILTTVMYALSNVALLFQAISIANASKSDQMLQNVLSADPKKALSIAEIVSLFSRGYIDENFANSEAQKSGYDAVKRDMLFRGAENPLDPERLQTAYFRKLIDKPEFEQQLKRLGYNQADRGVLTGLADILPALQDIIQMAVRDVFSPDTVAEFQLFADLPEEFVKEAAKQGLSKDWAEKYWGAHWRLPSALQGFEMFHREVIDFSQLSLLLRALDVSPFWRDKLTAIAYRPITRVDIRRMYALGLLTDADVNRRHRDLGYSPDDAAAMTRYVKAAAGEVVADEEVDVSSLTVSQLKSMLDLGTISKNDAVSQLREIGYSGDMAKLLVNSWITSTDIKIRQDLINRAIRKGIREDLNINQIEQLLVGINLAPDEARAISIILEVEARERDNIPSKSELKKMRTENVISLAEWQTTMKQHDYSDYWILKYQQLWGLT